MRRSLSLNIGNGSSDNSSSASSSPVSDAPPGKKRIVYDMQLPVQVFTASSRTSSVNMTSIMSEYNDDDTYSSEEHNPYNNLEWYTSYHHSQVWYFTIPAYIYTGSANVFGDLRFIDLSTFAPLYMLYLQCMLYVAHVLRNSPSCNSSEVRLVYDLVWQKGYVANDPVTHRLAARRIRLSSPSGADWPTFGKIIEDLTKDVYNSKRDRSSLNKRFSAAPLGTRFAFTELTPEKWREVVRNIYNLKGDKLAVDKDIREATEVNGWINSPMDSISHPLGLYNPANLGSLKTMLDEMSRIKNGAPVPFEYMDNFTDYEDYIKRRNPEEDCKDEFNRLAYIYPEKSKFAFRISLESMTYANFDSCYLPEKPRQSATTVVERSLMLGMVSNTDAVKAEYWQEYPSDGDIGVLGVRLARSLDPKESMDRYEQSSRIDPVVLQAFGMEQMQERSTAVIDNALRSLHEGDDHNDRRIALSRAHRVGILQMDDLLLSQDARLPESNKRIIHWYRELVASRAAKKLSISMTRRNGFANLSTFGNFMAQNLLALEAWCSINVVHVDILLSLVASHWVFRAHKDQFHILCTGPPAVGKSESFHTATTFMIDGTFHIISYRSPKSMAVGGENPDDPSALLFHTEMVHIMDEFAPVHMGASSTGRASGDGNSSSADVALFKGMLSTGKITSSINCKNEKNQSYSRLLTIECNSVQLLAMNYSPAHLEIAAVDRLFTMVKVEQDRQDNGGILAVVSGLKAGVVDKSGRREAFELRMKRHQAMSMLVHKCIRLGILPRVSMDLARVLAYNVIMRGIEQGLAKCGRVRFYLRVLLLVEQLVIMGAVDIFLDHEDSIVRDRPWDISLLLYIKKYLYCGIDHVAMALGLSSEQYESNVSQIIETQVILDFEKNAFRADELLIDPRTGMPCMPYSDNHTSNCAPLDNNSGNLKVDAARRLEQKSRHPETYAKVFHRNTQTWSVSSHDSSALNDSAVIRRYARELVANMTVKPTEDDVVQTLTALTRAHIDVFECTSQMTGTKIVKKPMLIISSKEISVPKTLIEAYKNGRHTNRLKLALEAQLDHRYAKPRDVLWGKVSDSPYLWDVISIPDNQSDRENTKKCFVHLKLDHIEKGVLDGSEDLLSERKEGEDESHSFEDENKDMTERYEQIDMDLDDWALSKHLNRCDISVHELRMGPHHDVYERMKNDWHSTNVMSVDALVYPANFESFWADDHEKILKHKKSVAENARNSSDASMASDSLAREQEKLKNWRYKAPKVAEPEEDKNEPEDVEMEEGTRRNMCASLPYETISNDRSEWREDWWKPYHDEVYNCGVSLPLLANRKDNDGQIERPRKMRKQLIEMEKVRSKEIRALEAGFALDEGFVSTQPPSAASSDEEDRVQSEEEESVLDGCFPRAMNLWDLRRDD